MPTQISYECPTKAVTVAQANHGSLGYHCLTTADFQLLLPTDYVQLRHSTAEEDSPYIHFFLDKILLEKAA